MKTLYQNEPALASAGSLLTIHNLAYLGLFWQRDMALTGPGLAAFQLAPARIPRPDLLHEGGPGLRRHAQRGEPQYAKEIQTPRFGSGLDGLLRDRQADLRGIVNGIDPEIWSPATSR